MNKIKPSKIEIDSIINLFSNGDLEKCLETIAILIKDYPEESLLFNIQGACYAALGQSDNSVKSYKTAITLKPDYAKAHYNLGGILHEIGNLDKSVHSYESALSIEPDYAEAHNNLGNVFRDLGNLDEAAKSFEKALTINQDYIEARYSLAIVLQKLGDLDSIDHFEKVLDMKPDFAEAHNNLGVALKDIGQVNEAVESYNKALKINPNYAQALNNLGNALRDLGKFEDAKEAYERALRINADYPTLHNNLGNVLRELGRLEEAIESYQTAISLNEDNPDSFNNLGVVFFTLGDLDSAIRAYKKAIIINPNFDNAHNNLGAAYKKIGEFDKAVDYYQTALVIDNQNFETHNNLGNAWSEIGNYDEAIKSFNKAIEINPDFEDAYNNLGITLLTQGRIDDAFKLNQKALSLNPNFAEGYVFQGRLFSEIDQQEEALISFEKANTINPKIDFNLSSILNMKMDLCDWDGIEDLVSDLPRKLNNSEKLIRPMLLSALIDDPTLQHKAAEIYSEFYFPESHLLPQIQIYPISSKTRVGYFSADFKEHPVANLTAELYELHDRNQFEIHAFSFGPDTNDAMNLRIKKGVDYFHEVSEMSDKEIAMLSRSLKIDIAVDLGGYTAGARTGIFALRAAPIQVNYLGYSCTMGAKYMDYIVADRTIISEDQKINYSEKIVYLPDCFMVNDTKVAKSEKIFNKAEAGLPSDSFIFCCFNSHHKFTENVFSSWMKILLSVDKSVLWLPSGDRSALNNLKKEAEKKDIDPNRLIFAPRLDLRGDHLNRIKLADLFLDTHPYNAHSTASDALQMGLPVLTYEGSSFASRVATSLNNALQLNELVVNSEDEYISLAIELAKKPEMIHAIKSKLNLNLSTSNLFNAGIFTKNIESAFEKMIDRSQKKLDPDHIYID